VDYYPMQKKWALENGIKLQKEFTRERQVELLLKQMHTFKPDVLYFERSAAFNVLPISVRKDLKRAIPSLRLITGHWSEDLIDIKKHADMDFVFCMDSCIAEQFKSVGVKNEILYFYFEEKIFNQLEEKRASNEIPFLFAGASGYLTRVHLNRYLFLREVLKNTPLEVWGMERPHSLKEHLRRFCRQTVSLLPLPLLKPLEAASHFKNGTKLSRVCRDARFFWGTKPLKKLFPQQTHDHVFGVDYYNLLQRAQVILNTHTVTPEMHANIRVFEATGVGGCLLTDRADLMEHLFKEGDEIVGYKSTDEAIEKAQYLLKHPGVCQAIGKRAQKRVWQEHLFSHRFPILYEGIKNNLDSKI